MAKLETATRLVGDGKKRIKNDFYPTPPHATQALLEVEEFSGTVWECACGDGAISKVLKSNGMRVLSTDLIDRGYGKRQQDFLAYSGDAVYDNIITNPPFALATEFIVKSKLHANQKIAMFLKTTFLEGVSRYQMFQDEEFPFKCMYQFSRRVSFGADAGTHKNGGMMAFAWFIWDREHVGAPFIKWIK